MVVRLPICLLRRLDLVKISQDGNLTGLSIALDYDLWPIAKQKQQSTDKLLAVLYELKEKARRC